jgi:hypothetical protein
MTGSGAAISTAIGTPLEAMAEAARPRLELVRYGREEAQRVSAGGTKKISDTAKGAAMLQVILDVWEGGRDLIRGWRR